jgi:hypothetical protein
MACGTLRGNRHYMNKGSSMKFVVVMPFRPEFDAIYAAIKSAVQAGAPARDLTCLRVDEDLRAGHITGKIDDHIRSADVCIADISDLNPNVMWEVGFIEALQKPLIAVSRSELALPFNIHDLSVLRYVPSELSRTLQDPLTKAVQQTLARLQTHRPKLAVAITGSRSAVPHRAMYAVRTATAPFLGPETTWYCGTSGSVDEAAAAFLFQEKQHVIGVCSSAHNISTEVEAIFAQHNMALLNADDVALPRSIHDLSWRDAFFVTKSDLIILIWDGKSTNISRLHEWLTSHGKDHLLAFA